MTGGATNFVTNIVVEKGQQHVSHNFSLLFSFFSWRVICINLTIALALRFFLFFPGGHSTDICINSTTPLAPRFFLSFFFGGYLCHFTIALAPCLFLFFPGGYRTGVGLISQDLFSLDGVSRVPKSPSCAYL